MVDRKLSTLLKHSTKNIDKRNRQELRGEELKKKRKKNEKKRRRSLTEFHSVGYYKSAGGYEKNGCIYEWRCFSHPTGVFHFPNGEAGKIQPPRSRPTRSSILFYARSTNTMRLRKKKTFRFGFSWSVAFFQRTLPTWIRIVKYIGRRIWLIM